MKKNLLVLLCCTFMFSSCMTIFTKPRQTLTFTGENGIRLYDGTNNVKVGEIKEGNSVSINMKKNISDKIIIAKKEGYANTPLMIESNFNVKGLWNILFWPGFLVDLGTGQINKYDPYIYNIEMEKEK